MSLRDGGLETRPAGQGETVGVERHSHAAEDLNTLRKVSGMDNGRGRKPSEGLN